MDSAIANSKSPFPGLAKGLSKGINSIDQLMDSMMKNNASGSSKSVGTKDVKAKGRFAEAICLFTTIPSGSKGLWMD
jgi:hypothetical protein